MRIKAIVRDGDADGFYDAARDRSGNVEAYGELFADAELHSENEIAAVIRTGGEPGNEDDTLAVMQLTGHDLVIIR